MKKTVKIILAAMLAALLVFCVACSGAENGGDTAAQQNSEQNGNSTGESTIVGVWKLPKEEWINKDKSEVWVFDADGSTFHYYQLTTDYKVTNTIDGSYKLEGDQLTITMAGWTLPAYTISLKDADTMTRVDHETEVTLTRYKGEIKK